MDFFEGIGKKVEKAGHDVIQKTKNMTESGQLNSQIVDEEKKINSLLNKIGRIYLEKSGENPEEEFIPCVTEIKESLNRIEFYKEQVKKAKGIINCPNCNAEIESDSLYCSQCNFSLQNSSNFNHTTQPLNESRIYCTGCGVALEAESMFCDQCGTKVNKTEGKF